MLIINKEGNEVWLYGKNSNIKNYEIVLTQSGKLIYIGGNIEVLQQVLGFKFQAREKDAEDIFYNKLQTTLGSGSFNLFTLKETEK